MLVEIYNWLGWFLGKIPGEAWAALIAIGGVLLANRGARREATRQRWFEMRRGVYLDCADAVAQANGVLGRMGELDLPNREVARIVNDAVARLAKVQIVATLPTVKAVSEYQVTLTECLTALWPGRMELLQRGALMAHFDKQIQAAIADKNRWLEEMKLANVQQKSTTDPQYFERLKSQFTLADQLQSNLMEQHQALAIEQRRQALNFVDSSLTLSGKMLKCLPEALTRARSELELGGDQEEEAFRAILTDMSARQTSAVRGLATKAGEMAERIAAQGTSGNDPRSGKA